MKDKQIAERYALGFMEAVGKDNYTKLIIEVKALKSILSDNPEIVNIFASPVVADKDKIDIINPFVEQSEFKDYWHNFMMLLNEKGRAPLFGLVADCLEEYILEELNIVKVTIKTAYELAEDMRKKLISYISEKINKEVEPTFVTDSSVIGGFIAESDNFIVDSSVKHSLEKFRLSLINM
ncbi:MAG: ATP synthase F1 subunit delta [Candidatus Cloacimonetes bacterium 4572_65]|nr:MAG: ATP synthase F1 subunit delta [Candidatus Cloacimonetes bacterium 4572_65]